MLVFLKAASVLKLDSYWVKSISKAADALIKVFPIVTTWKGFWKCDKKSAKIVDNRGFRKPVHLLLATFANLLMTAIAGFSKNASIS